VVVVALAGRDWTMAAAGSDSEVLVCLALAVSRSQSRSVSVGGSAPSSEGLQIVTGGGGASGTVGGRRWVVQFHECRAAFHATTRHDG